VAIVKHTLEEIRARRGKTDWDRLDAMTDEEILKAAAEDPDTFVPTEDELKRFKRVPRQGMAETEAAYDAAAVDERSVVLMLLYLVFVEIEGSASLEDAQRLADVVHNAPLRLSDEDRSKNTLGVIRTRASKLGVAERIERLIDVARHLAARSKE